MSNDNHKISAIPLDAAITAYGGADPVVSAMNDRFLPAMDFYRYVNNEWQSHIHLPAYSGSFGVSEEIEEDVKVTLINLMNTLRKKQPAHPLSLLSDSFFNTHVQHNGIMELQKLLNRFDCMSTADDVGHYIGIMNKLQSSAPLSFVVANDSFNAEHCAVYIYEPYLGLPDYEYYTTGPRNKIILKYAHMLTEVGKLLNIEDLETVIAFEASLIPYLTKDTQMRNMSFVYNKFTFGELIKTYPYIPWQTILLGWGLKKEHHASTPFIVTNKLFLTHMNRMFHTVSLDMWRAWMRSQVILSFMEYLPPPFDDLYFELFEKELKGVSQKIPQKDLTCKVLQTFTPNDLGKLFVDYYVPNGTKDYAVQMVGKLKKAVIERLSALSWMADSTKATAIRKVKNMKFQVGYPKLWESETAHVAMDAAHPILNILALNTHDTQKMLHDLSTGNCAKSPEKWEDGVFEVNAYYYPEGNMMVVPAGILRPPFFDLKRSIAWNLGGIGAAIGHEITHGFDADGRQYDEKGDYRNWWTDADSKTFTKMTRAIIQLFDGVEYMGGKVDGKLTLSENIADLGGLAVALQALKHDLPADKAKQKAAYRDFFTSYAVSWRNKDRPKKAKQALLLDLHAPAPLRVNLIVRQFEEFYIAFDIQPTDAGYIVPERRIMLW